MSEVKATDEAEAVLRAVRSRHDGVLTITLAGGCCEGSAPHLYEDYLLPFGAGEIGRVADIPVFLPREWQELYADAKLLIDVVDDPASDAMSLETRLGKRLVIRE